MAAKCDVIEQLRQRVKELEYEESKSADMAHKNMQLWLEVSEKLAAAEQRLAELEAELTVSVGQTRYLMKDQKVKYEQLAASQLDNLRLRSALEVIRDNTKENPTFLVCKEALSTPTDIEV